MHIWLEQMEMTDEEMNLITEAIESYIKRNDIDYDEENGFSWGVYAEYDQVD